MAYQAEISRTNPAAFLFLIDQSSSMADPFGASNSGKSKADGVAAAINRLLHNIVIKCAKGESIRDYYYVGLIGYGANLQLGFAGELAGDVLQPVSRIADHPMRIEERIKKNDDGAGGVVEEAVKFPVWIEPKANGRTPMKEAFTKAVPIVRDWIEKHPGSFPPIVINITDGESTDGDPSEAANVIKEQATSDGNILLYNVHLSSNRSAALEYPSEDGELPDEYARLLFNMSSTLPGHMAEAAKQEGYSVTEKSRGFVFNGDIVAVISFLDIGTRPANMR